MSNTTAMAELDGHIKRVQELADLGKRSAPAVARAVDKVFQRQIAAGTDANGKAWVPTRDGGKPLAGAGKNLVVVAVGATVFARLTNHVARHNNGRARGGIARPILPTEGLPTEMARAIKAVMVDEFNDAMGGS